MSNQRMSARQNIGGNIPTLIVGWLVTIILFVAGNFITGNRADATEQKAKEAKVQEQIDTKASKEELKEAIDGVRKENNIQNEWIIKTLDRIDKRTERLEDRL